MPSRTGPTTRSSATSLTERARRNERRDLAGWLVLVAAGLGVSALAVRVAGELGTAAAPFTGSYLFRLDPAMVLAPLLAAVVLVVVRAGGHERLGWRLLLLAGYATAAGWSIALGVAHGGHALAVPLNGPDEYLPDVAEVGNAPGHFFDTFTDQAAALTPTTREHPPLPVLLLWALQHLGVHRPAMLGTLATLAGASVVPLVAVSVRSLAGEAAARRLVPVLMLAPYGLWAAGSMDAVTAALGAAVVATGVTASSPGRPAPARLLWSVLCGLLLGLAALFSYSVGWLAGSLLCLYFVRRRPLLNISTGSCALAPLVAAEMAGFSWPDGLAMSRQAAAGSADTPHPALLWAVLELVVLLLAAGPALVASARKIRLTPAWPFLVGAALGIGYAMLAGLARGAAERSWLPFFPWLLVAAVAPERRGAEPTRTPLLLVAAGALTAVCLQAVLRTPG